MIHKTCENILLLKAMIVDFHLMFRLTKGGVSRVNRKCTLDFATIRLLTFNTGTMISAYSGFYKLNATQGIKMASPAGAKRFEFNTVKEFLDLFNITIIHFISICFI
jgi:hypothetical protein